MGLQEDPYTFFLDLIRLALLFQLAAAGLVFYVTELGLGGDAGDAFRAVGGLLLGYTLRLGIKVEQLVSWQGTTLAGLGQGRDAWTCLGMSLVAWSSSAASDPDIVFSLS
jgi:hypothetical protein